MRHAPSHQRTRACCRNQPRPGAQRRKKKNTAARRVMCGFGLIRTPGCNPPRSIPVGHVRQPRSEQQPAGNLSCLAHGVAGEALTGAGTRLGVPGSASAKTWCAKTWLRAGRGKPGNEPTAERVRAHPLPVATDLCGQDARTRLAPPSVWPMGRQ